MPLDVERVIDSDLFSIASGDEFKVAFRLWAKSWAQVPAASLPGDERILAALAGLGENFPKWRRVRDVAMRGWVLCSDGRFYHPVIAEKAIEAMGKKEDHDERQENEENRQKRHRQRRAEMFAILRDHGIVPGWKTPTADLERLVASLPDTQPVTEPVTESVTGETPVTSPRTAKTGTVQDRTVNLKTPVVALPVDPAPPAPSEPDNATSTRRGKIAALLRTLGAQGVTPAKVESYGWAENPDVTDEVIRAAWNIARDRNPAPARIDSNYVATIMPDVLNPKPPKERKPYDPWSKTNAGIERKCRELGIAFGSRSYDELRDLCFGEIRKREARAA